MASSSSEEDRNSVKSTRTETSQSQILHPQQPEQLPAGYPHPPPYQGYPPQPYQAYPGNNYQYASPQPQPQLQGYYPSNQQTYVLFGPPQRSLAYKLARAILVTMIVLFLGMSFMSFLAWLIYGSDIPEFHAESLEMKILDMNNMALNASWSANMSVKNPSNKYEVSYDYLEATLVYDDHLLDTNYVSPFVLAKKEKRNYSSEFQTPNENQKNVVGAMWVKDMEKERQEKESISFDLRIVVNVDFRSKDHDRSLSRTLKVLCGDLKLVFPSPADSVAKFQDGEKECLILST